MEHQSNYNAIAENVNNRLYAHVTRKLIDGQNVDGFNKNTPEPWGAIIEAILATPKNPQQRTNAFEAAIAGLEDKNEIQAAVLAADLGADLGELIPGPKTFADISEMLGPISWDWEGWLPRGFLTIIASESGVGKSALMLALADCYIRGKPWPDGSNFTGEIGAVLWCEAEAAQAINLERAKTWGIPLEMLYTPLNNPLEDFNMQEPDHMAAIYELSIRPEVKLVIVDSLSGADPKSEKSTEDSVTVKYLAQLARDTTKPLGVSHHLRKRGLFDGDTISIDRLRGSSAIVQTARLVWALDVPDPHDKEWKRLQVVKSNLAKFPEPVGMSITERGVIFGAAPEEPKIDTVMDKAIDLLMALLQQEPLPADTIKQEFDGAGISEATMKRAKAKLGIISTKKKEGWFWGLPAKGQYDL